MDLKTELLRLVNKSVAEASYDKTVKGVVITTLDSGICRVKINGAEYSAPCLTSLNPSKGDKVWVLLPQSELKDAVIIGRRS